MSDDSKSYIHGHSPTVLKAHARRTAAADATYLLPHIRPDFHILDVGCGPGTISADLAALVPAGHLTCLDSSPDALAAARSTIAARSLPNTSFVPGSATALPFPEGTFDVVHAHQVLIHIPDAAAAMREMRRVLRPGGILASRDMIMATCTWYPALPALDGWRRGITGSIAATGADPEFGRRLKSVALAAGFDREKIRAATSSWCFQSAEEVGFWGESVASRLEGGELVEKTVEGGLMTREELGETVRACREWAGREDAIFAVMNGEILCWK